MSVSEPVPLRSRLISSTRWHVFVTVVLLFASFAVQVGIARRFALIGLGEYVSTSIAIFLASVVALNGLPLAASHGVAARLERGDQFGASRVASTGLVMALVSSAVVSAVAALAWPSLSGILRLAAPVPAWSVGLSVLAGGSMHFVPLIFQARFQMATAGAITLAQPFAAIVLLGWDTLNPGSVRPGILSVGGYLLGGVTATLLFVAAHRSGPSLGEVRPLIVRSLRSLPLLYASTFSAWVDRLMISLLLGPAALGTYQAAAILIEGVLRVPRNVSPFLLSAYARVSSRSSASVGRLAGVHARLWTAGAVVFAAGLIASADGIVTTLFGAGSFAVTDPLRIMTLALVPGLLSLLLTTVATGATAVAGTNVLLVSLATIAMQVVSMVVLAPRLGVTGAAAAYVVATATGALVYLGVASRHGVGVPAGRLAAVTALALATGVVVAAAPASWPLRAVVALAAVAFVAARALLGPDERELLRHFITLR